MEAKTTFDGEVIRPTQMPIKPSPVKTPDHGLFMYFSAVKKSQKMFVAEVFHYVNQVTSCLFLSHNPSGIPDLKLLPQTKAATLLFIVDLHSNL